MRQGPPLAIVVAAGGRNDPIPDEDDGKLLSGSRFRRTLAWHIYRRPRGLVAGAIQYGQLRTQMFLGYAGTYASGFCDEAAMEEFLVRLEELADDVAHLDAGEHVSGPAARRYGTRVRNGQARFAGRIIRSAQAARAMLANPSLQVFPGHGMTCVFDARKALCETSGDDARRTPALDDCRPNCGNIARTDRDIAVIRADIDRLSKITADPLSPPIRHRREAGQLRELQQIADRHELTRPPRRTPQMADPRERKEIEAAIQRLLAGTLLRSTGELTVVQLAVEAGVKRWKLTHEHVDLMRSFQAAARQANAESPLIAPWRARAVGLEADNRALRQRNTELRATVQAYAEVITDLSTAIESSPSPALASVRPLR